MDQKEQALLVFNAHKEKSRPEIIDFAIEVEFGEIGERIAAHMLLMMSSDQRMEEDGTMGLEKHSEWMAEKARNFSDDNAPFPYDQAIEARTALLEAEKYDADALYNFVSCFSAEDLMKVGI